MSLFGGEFFEGEITGVFGIGLAVVEFDRGAGG